MNDIDIKAIMNKVDEEVIRKRKYDSYIQTIKRLEGIPEDQTQNKSVYELLGQMQRVKSLNIPLSTKTGIVAKVSNWFLLKVYFVVAKIFDEYLRNQMTLTEGILKEIDTIKTEMNVNDMDFFPRTSYVDKFSFSPEYIDYTSNHMVKYVKPDDKVLDVGSYDNGITQVYANLKLKQITFLTDQTTNLYHKNIVSEIVNKKPYMGLAEIKGRKFDLISFISTAEYFSFSYLIALFEKLGDFVEKNGIIYILSKDPSDIETFMNNSDPYVKKMIHKELLEFTLNHLDYSIKEVSLHQIGTNKYYAFIIQKN